MLFLLKPSENGATGADAVRGIFIRDRRCSERRSLQYTARRKLLLYGDVNGAHLKAQQLETLLALLTAGIAAVLVQDAQLYVIVLPRTVEK